MCVRLRRLVLLWSFLLVLPLPASVLYDNGPIIGSYGGIGIASWVEGTHNEWYMATNSFTLSADSIFTGVTFGAEFYAGDSGLTVDWAITSTPFGPSLAQGTASLAGTYLFTNPGYDPVDAWAESFFVDPVELAAGTYWLQLSNCMTSNYDWAYWDVNQGPSVAYQKYQYQEGTDLYPGQGKVPYSESFQILGSEAAPEPGSLVLLSSGALLLAIRHFRQRAGRISRR
jgi:hypothetical protein